MEQEIEYLKAENQKLKQKMEELEKITASYTNGIKEILYQIRSLNEIISREHDTNVKEHILMRSTLQNVCYEFNDPDKESVFFYPKIVDIEKTIDLIVNEKKSIARFGDGEISLIVGRNDRTRFQKENKELGKRLKEVLQSDIPELMIGIANNYGRLEEYNDFGADSIRVYMQPDIRREHMELLSRDKVYYDAYMSRPYVMYRDNMTDGPKKRFQHLQKIWDGRDVIMVEGGQTRLGVGNDLFDNCKSIRRILAPVTDSYSRYEEILEASKRNATKDVLFIIAIGPAAGILAYDLTLEGYQAVDVGHIDVEYEWMRAGKGERCPIDNKYTHEIIGREEAVEIHDPIYESQIIEAYL